MNESRLTLRHPSGFFAAGCEMRDALTLLSDGAFKIYVYVCLHADRRNGPVALSHGGTGSGHRP
jgi:hypothetical protein